jgi:hypothetical protein
MAIGWFICPYIRQDRNGRVTRYCAMDNYTAAIAADGGRWSEIEVLGNMALVKVNASATTLTTIGAAAGFMRVLSKISLSDPLSDLTTAQRTAILNKLQALGYTAQEISSALGGTLANWRTKTFGDLLRFVTTRRIPPRYDSVLDQVVFDLAAVPCSRSVSEVDGVVT